MIYWITSAFLTGLLGSTHCVGMCGPLALSLPLNSNQRFEKIVSILLYNLGRVFTYSVYGFVLGFVSSWLIPEAWQKTFSILAGLFLISLGLLYFFHVQFPKRINTFPFYQNIIQSLQKLYTKEGRLNIILIGMLNGLLPCGMIYIALVSAVALASPGYSMLYMFFFGLGTLPAMWAVMFFMNLISIQVRTHLKKIYPIFFLAMGLLLVVRGALYELPTTQSTITKHGLIFCSR
ncbi:MAG: sulfite exporter TauE/SafE family protein [Chitinophagaceae bacterium]